MNRWNIPDQIEREVRERDKTCVYCGVQMIERMPPSGSRKALATWEHIINDSSIVTPENIALCCWSCNSSKGRKQLAVWIRSSYCKERGICEDTVADVVKLALRIHVGAPSIFPLSEATGKALLIENPIMTIPEGRDTNAQQEAIFRQLARHATIEAY